MLSEEAKVTRVLQKSGRKLAAAVEFVATALQNGGRLFYVGAGTSGRLGVQDASECPPTFRTPPGMVQGIIAGGDAALRRAVEGAEDDARAGGREVGKRAVGANDVVVGIAASGTTPYVWGALCEAKQRGAGTILICFNPHLAIPPTWQPDHVLAFNLGPEILTGSTRLKCGTATKLILNLLTTLAMVRLGKVISNLMVDVAPTNVKLRQRAARIVSELTAVAPARATQELTRNDWSIRKTVRALRPGTASRRA
jgi:N-acetylmuramic acid 6-phosphate etherase